MGFTQNYQDVPDWEPKSEGYQTGAKVKYKGNIFHANFWASEPGVGDPNSNGWRFYDELYDQTSGARTEQAKIIAYIPTWRKREGFDYANSEMYQYITHGIISFLMFSETNLGEFEPKSLEDVKEVLPDVVTTGHGSDVKISIALGGATDYGFLNLMTSVGNNSESPLLDKAVQNVVNFVNSNNLDGVDLDLECWWDKNGDPSKDQGGRTEMDGPHPAGYALTHFAQRLKQAMPDKLVSAAVFGTSWYGNNYDAKLADHVDWLGLMTYDLTGSWNASPVGPHSALLKIFAQEAYLPEQQGQWPSGGPADNPILSVEDSLWYWTNPMFTNWQGKGQGIPRDKVALGVPIYGYDFAYAKEPDDLSGQVPPGYKAIRYKDIVTQFPDAKVDPENAEGRSDDNIRVNGNTPRPPFVNAAGDYPYAHNIYFESPGSAANKLYFSKYLGTQGVIIWELSNDVWEEGKSIIRRLYEESGNPKKEPLNEEKREILVKYAPRVYLHEDEKYYPSSVSWAFDRMDRVYITDAHEQEEGKYNNKWHLVPKEDLEEGGHQELDLYQGQKKLDEVPVYAFWVPHDNNEVDLVYYFWSPYNHVKKYSPNFLYSQGNHIGDWEHISIRMVNNEPVEVYAPYHEWGENRLWNKVEKQDGTHPIIYSAKGSHGSWFEAGDHVYREVASFLQVNLVDECSEGEPWDTWNNVEAFYWDKEEGKRRPLMGNKEFPNSELPQWLHRGADQEDNGDSDPASGPIDRWGYRDYEKRGRHSFPGPDELIQGPTGPIDKTPLNGTDFTGRIDFFEGNDAQETLVYSISDKKDEDSGKLSENENENDEARSAKLIHVRKGCKITVFNDPEGKTDDDYCIIETLKEIPFEHIVRTFEKSYDDEYVRVSYTEVGGGWPWNTAGLDGKVSRIRID